MIKNKLRRVRGGILLFLCLAIYGPVSLWAGPNVLDINRLKDLGVSQTTLEDIVKYSLTPRARKHMEADFILQLASYGGNPLTRAYLDMELSSSHSPTAPLSQGKVLEMIQKRVAVSQVIAAIETALSESQRGEDFYGSSPPSAGSEISVSDIPGDFNNTGPILAAAAVGAAPVAGAALNSGSSAALPPVPMSEISPEYTSSADSVPFERSQMESEEVLQPSVQAASAPALASSPALAEAAATPYSMNPFLAEGDAPVLAMEMAGAGLANGAPHPLRDLKTLPVVPAVPPKGEPRAEEAAEEATGSASASSVPYPVREPGPEHTFYMGSFEAVTLDGHRVDVHRNSKSGYLGTRVESTPSGKKVHRSFSGKPESVEEGARGSDAPKKRSALGGTPAELSDFLP
jgi:hypothetical protein